MQKRRVENRPDLGGLSVKAYIADVQQRYGLQVVPLSDRIAMHAAEVPAMYGYGDPARLSGCGGLLNEFRHTKEA